MFGLLKKGNHLFEFVVPVTKGAACRLNIDWSFGKVVCYAAGPDEDAAKQVAIQQLQIARCVVEPGWQVREVDLVWSGSVFTHLDAPQWVPLLRYIARALAPGGVAVLTTHGRRVAWRIQWPARAPARSAWSCADRGTAGRCCRCSPHSPGLSPRSDPPSRGC